MKVLLVDVDSKIPNLALMKVSHYYKTRGYEVELKKLNFDYYPKERQQVFIDASEYFSVWVSIIFPINKEVVKINNCENVYFGGTGYDLTIKLSKEVDDLDPDYSIYPDNKISYGFITRGCIRNCYFCIVPQKEGKIYKYNNINNIVKHKIVCFLDNNILAYPDYEKEFNYLIKNKIRCFFNSGLDIRLIDNKNSFLLSELNYYGEYLFSFDNINNIELITEKLEILKTEIRKDWKIKFNIYCNANMPLRDTLDRIEFCKNERCLPYLMRDINCWTSENKNFYTDLSAWCNQPSLFKKMSFEEFMPKRTNNKERQELSILKYNSKEARR
jgi:hypothetical protein